MPHLGLQELASRSLPCEKSHSLGCFFSFMIYFVGAGEETCWMSLCNDVYPFIFSKFFFIPIFFQPKHTNTLPLYLGNHCSLFPAASQRGQAGLAPLLWKPAAAMNQLQKLLNWFCELPPIPDTLPGCPRATQSLFSLQLIGFPSFSSFNFWTALLQVGRRFREGNGQEHNSSPLQPAELRRSSLFHPCFWY